MSVKNLPLDSGKRIQKVFEHLQRGWVCAGKSEKNHFILRNPAHPYLFLSIPDHPHVDRHTLKAELRKAEITDDDFAEAYELLYGRRLSRETSNNVHELELCPFCREVIKPGEETTLQESGLNAHTACHQKQFGTA